MACKVQCIGCAEVIELAKVNPSVNKAMWRVFCPPCARTFTYVHNWLTVGQSDKTVVQRPIKCIGCELPIHVANINTALVVPYTWCFHCKNKLLVESRWEEFRRVGEDPFPEYAPRVIVPGIQIGGH